MSETKFSSYARTTTKYKNTLNATPNLRIQLSNIKLEKIICEEKIKTTLCIKNLLVCGVLDFKPIFLYIQY